MGQLVAIKFFLLIRKENWRLNSVSEHIFDEFILNVGFNFINLVLLEILNSLFNPKIVIDRVTAIKKFDGTDFHFEETHDLFVISGREDIKVVSVNFITLVVLLRKKSDSKLNYIENVPQIIFLQISFHGGVGARQSFIRSDSGHFEVDGH